MRPRGGAGSAYRVLTQVTIAKECLGGREGWIIGRPPNRVLYGQPVDTALPPELHWALMNGGTGLDPPPTLMMHSQRRAKEVRGRVGGGDLRGTRPRRGAGGGEGGREDVAFFLLPMLFVFLKFFSCVFCY